MLVIWPVPYPPLLFAELEDRFIIHVDDCGPTRRAKRVSARKCVNTQQAERICLMELEIRLASTQGNRSCEFLPRRASQFDPIIDKEIKFISNLRWNVLIFAQTVPSVPLREQPDGKID